MYCLFSILCETRLSIIASPNVNVLTYFIGRLSVFVSNQMTSLEHQLTSLGDITSMLSYLSV